MAPIALTTVVFILSGSVTVTAGDGTQRNFNAGDAVFLDHEESRGHLTRLKREQEVVAVGINVPQRRA